MTLVYNPYLANGPIPPVPPPVPPPKDTSFTGSSGSILYDAKTIFGGLSKSFDHSVHTLAVDPEIRKKFNLPQSEKFIGDFWAKCTDCSNRPMRAHIIVYSFHLVFILKAPTVPGGSVLTEADILIPITHVVSWEQGRTQAGGAPGAPPMIMPLPFGPNVLSPDAVRIYTQDNRMHLFWGFEKPVTDFYATFDPIWRNCRPDLARPINPQPVPQPQPYPGYPPQPQYPPQQGGYPPQPQYPPQQGGYPPPPGAPALPPQYAPQYSVSMPPRK